MLTYSQIQQGCGKSFARKMTLTKHTRRRHPGRQQPGRHATATIPRTVKSQPTEAKLQSIGSSTSPYSPSSLALAMQGVTPNVSTHLSAPPTPHRHPATIPVGPGYQASSALSHAYSSSVPAVGYPASHMPPPVPHSAGPAAHGLHTTVHVHHMNRADGHSRHPSSSYFYPASNTTYSSARMSPISRAQQPGYSNSGASGSSVSSASTPSPPPLEATTPTSAAFPLSLGSSTFYKESPTYSHYRSVSRSHGPANLDHPFSSYSPQPTTRHGHTSNSSLSASIGQYEHRFRPMGASAGQ